MADVRPFRGFRYNSGQGKDLSAVITPPYDVISPEQQLAYHQKHAHNIIRLEFGQDLPGDNPQANKYTRAAAILAEWIRQGVLKQEDRPAFYLTEHRFPFQKGHRSYFGLIAAVKLEEFGVGSILPTEVTMRGPIADRLELLRACRANLSPIMGMFDPAKEDFLSLFKGTVSQGPSLTATNTDGVTFNVWVVTDETIVKSVSAFFSRKPIYIADGHHRYTTALAYREERLKSDPAIKPEDPCNFIMMTMISSADPGLTLMPTHRLVKNITPDRLSQLTGTLAEQFHIQPLPSASSNLDRNLPKWQEALHKIGLKSPAFGLYGLEKGVCWVLTARNTASLQEMMPKDKPAAWKNLDVSLLHSSILSALLGIDSAEKEKEHLEFSSDAAKLLSEVNDGKGQLAFLLNAVPIADVMAIADAGTRMPPKSTYFYPKTAAGLVINPLF